MAMPAMLVATPIYHYMQGSTDVLPSRPESINYHHLCLGNYKKCNHTSLVEASCRSNGIITAGTSTYQQTIKKVFGQRGPRIVFNIDVFKNLLLQWIVQMNVSFRVCEDVTPSALVTPQDMQLV